jgi:hypothetical protein
VDGWPHGRAIALRAARWTPAAAAAVVCGAVLVAFGTPVGAVALYAVYWVATAVVPGTLLWRMLRIPPRSALEEIAAGTALGLAVQVFGTFVLGRLGWPPHLALLWCLAVVVACLAVPGLRRLWRSEATEPVPPWMSWSLVAASLAAVWWTANSSFRRNPLDAVPGFPGQYFATAPYIDMPFHQSLAAAVLRGGDGFPSVPSVPLRYALMVYEHLADAARWTGVDLTLLVMRLHTVPLLVLAVVLCGVLAHRIAGSAGAGALGGVLGYLTNPPSLFHDVYGPFATIAALNGGTFRSPTQTFGQPVFHVLVLLLVVLMCERAASRWAYAAVAVLAFVAGGAKATFLPTILCGLVLALLVGWAVRSRRAMVPITLAGVVGVAFLAALVLVLGTNSRGLEISDGTNLLSRLPVSGALGPLAQLDVRVTAIALVVAIWATGVIGMLAALVLRRRDISVWFVAGIGAAGVGATILGEHPGLSQAYFLRGVWPLLGVLAAVGLVELCRRAGARHIAWPGLGAALAAGLALAVLVRRETTLPTVFTGRSVTYAELAAPVAIVVGAGLVAGVAAAAVLRAGGTGTPAPARAARARTAPVWLGLLVSVGLVQGAAFTEVAVSGLAPQPTPPRGEGTSIPVDGAEAARWLRSRSDPSDVVVTNMHCLGPVSYDARCASRHFWLAALAERDVLVEGWAYSAPSPEVAPGFTGISDPFWDPDLIAANDAAIYAPSARTVEWLRSHSAEWVFVDRRVAPESPELDEYLDLVLERGRFAVYRVP